MCIKRSLSCRGGCELRRGYGLRAQVAFSGGNGADFKELICGELFGDAELEVVGGEGGSPGRVLRFFGVVEGENAMSAVELGLAKCSGFGFAEGPEFAGAAMDDFAPDLGTEGGGFCAGAGRVRENVEVGKWERVDETKRGFVVGLGFTREASDYVGANGSVGKKFADKFHAPGVMLGAIPAMHRGQDAVRTGLERHVEVFGDAIGTSEKGDEVLRDIERLDGTDTEASEIGFVENAAQEIENVGAGRKIAPPGAKIDAAENDFLKTGIREAMNLGKDFFGREAATLAADVRDHAEGAAVVAAILDFQCGASVIPLSTEDGRNENFAGGEDVSGEDLGRRRTMSGRGCRPYKLDWDEILFGGSDEIGDLWFVGIAYDMGDAREDGQFFWCALSVTSGDENFGGGVLRVDFANGVAGLRVSSGSDGAGIDDDEFGCVWGGSGAAATVKQLPLDGGAIGLCGAASELFDVEASHFRMDFGF